ncbi:MAG: lysophospholipid acyltransferase family protein [Candidatus Nanopelagicales bacterium]
MTRKSSAGKNLKAIAGIVRPPLALLTKREYQGVENLGIDSGIVVCPNHISWIDPLVIAHFLWDNDRPPRFLGKASLFRLPILGKIIKNAGQIPVYRNSNAAALSVNYSIASVKRGEAVVIYPEGTLTRDPNLWPMTGKSGAVNVALSANVPLIPVAQWGAQEMMAPYQKKLTLFPRKTIKIIAGKQLHLDDLRGRPIDSEVLKVGTARLMREIANLLAQLRKEDPPTELYKWGSNR